MNVLAIGSHPDDIEYGCGGTLLKWAEQGYNVHLYIATEGEFGKNGADRKKEQLNAAQLIKSKRIFWGEYRDTEVPVNQKHISDLENIIKIINADYVFVHYFNDTHQDHRNLANCVLTAARNVSNFLFYEGPTTQNFNPNVFVNIEKELPAKIKLLEAHKSQVLKTNINNLTILEMAHSNVNFRGIQGRVKYAEAFLSQRLLLK